MPKVDQPRQSDREEFGVPGEEMLGDFGGFIDAERDAHRQKHQAGVDGAVAERFEKGKGGQAAVEQAGAFLLQLAGQQQVKHAGDEGNRKRGIGKQQHDDVDFIDDFVQQQRRQLAVEVDAEIRQHVQDQNDRLDEHAQRAFAQPPFQAEIDHWTGLCQQ